MFYKNLKAPIAGAKTKTRRWLYNHKSIHWILNSLQILKIFNQHYGYKNSVQSGEPRDAQNSPLPWYTYPAIAFLKQFDFSEKSVFEWGAGSSSRFWCQFAKSVVSVEHNQSWYEKLQSIKPQNLRLEFAPDKAAYVSAIKQAFDVIIVDGIHRYECAKLAPAHLKPGGMIILDNADWNPKSAAYLRTAGLLQIDFQGLGPLNAYAWNTAIFLHRDFNFKRLAPSPSVIGGIIQYADEQD